jgi:hypothetical protein
LRFSTILFTGSALFLLLLFSLLPSRLAEPYSQTFSGDALQYSILAEHLLREGTYSLDGVVPSSEREPGYSLFLALIYFLFSFENRTALFVLQGLLYLFASLFFTREFARGSSKRAAALCFLFLVLTPSVFHSLLSAYREGFALSITLLFAAAFLVTLRVRTFTSALLSGLLLGLLLLTYLSFLFLPLLLLPFLRTLHFPWRLTLPLLLIPLLVFSPWVVRNLVQGQSCLLGGCGRAAFMWVVRGEQVRTLRGLDSFRCLSAEYLSRELPERLRACSTEELYSVSQATSWEEDELLRAGEEGRRAVLRALPRYLGHSLVLALEYHFPYVNGWGFVYNLLELSATMVLSMGVLLSLSVLHKEQWFFLLLIGYATMVFALTEAIPRYRLPILFCYAALASLGYTRLLCRDRLP